MDNITQYIFGYCFLNENGNGENNTCVLKYLYLSFVFKKCMHIITIELRYRPKYGLWFDNINMLP
jgi:hypothetical protein